MDVIQRAHLRQKLGAFALAVVATGWFTGTGATAPSHTPLRRAAWGQVATTLGGPKLVTWMESPSVGISARTDIRLRAPTTGPEVGKVTLYVPSGYRLDLTAPPGTIEGNVLLTTGSDGAVGDLMAVDPAAYANAPQSQACAPGSHAAVWTMPLDFVISSMRAVVPIYLDPTTGDETGLGAYKLQICLPLALIPSPGGWPTGSRLRELILRFARITNPVAAAVYLWRALVSNPDESGNPDPSTTYELRSDVPLPANLTLTGRLDRNDDRALLNGRYTAETLPTGGIPIALYRVTRGGARRHVATTRTSADGSYHFLRQLAKTSTYRTEVSGVGRCAGDSAAPRGCIDETRGAIDSLDTRIVVPSR